MLDEKGDTLLTAFKRGHGFTKVSSEHPLKKHPSLERAERRALHFNVKPHRSPSRQTKDETKACMQDAYSRPCMVLAMIP